MEIFNRIFCNIDENFLFTPLNNNTVKKKINIAPIKLSLPLYI